MPRAVAERALRFAASDGEKAGIIFFGGEPLLHRELIAAVTAYGAGLEREGRGRFHYKITTNGLLLDEAFLAFADTNEMLIGLSCDGPGAAHDAHRRLPDGTGSWATLAPRLELLLARRPNANLLVTVNPDTVAWLAQSVRALVEDFGARYLIVSLNHAADWGEADVRHLEQALERIAEHYLRWTRAGRRFYFSPFESAIASLIDPTYACHGRCDLGAHQLSVDPAGHVYPCVQFVGAGPESSYCIGHVETGVEHERLTALRAQTRHEPEACRACALRDRCHHTCGCLNWQTTGRLDRFAPVLCAYERLRLTIADRVAGQLYAERDPEFLHKHYNRAWPVLNLLADAAGLPPS